MPVAAGIIVRMERATVNRKLSVAVLTPQMSFLRSMTKPACAYSSRYIQAMARKCGICHRKRTPNKIHAPLPMEGRAAVHPMIGGMAPETAPTMMQKDVFRFIGV